MELSTRIVLREKYLLQNILGKLGPFDTTYLAKKIDGDDEKVVIREFFPTFLVKRKGTDFTVRYPSPGDKLLFDYGKSLYVRYLKQQEGFRHPNVATQLSHFSENGTVYVVRPYFRGVQLAEFLEVGKKVVGTQAALSIMNAVMRGLHQANLRGLVHSSISPRSIFLKTNGKPLLLWFAYPRIEFAQECNRINDIYEPGYIAPEVILKGDSIGAWTDVYGCAATIYTLLTGKRIQSAFDRVISDHVDADVQTAKQIPGPLKTVLIEGLALKASLRPKAVSVFRERFVAAMQNPSASSISTPSLSSSHPNPEEWFEAPGSKQNTSWKRNGEPRQPPSSKDGLKEKPLKRDKTDSTSESFPQTSPLGSNRAAPKDSKEPVRPTIHAPQGPYISPEYLSKDVNSQEPVKYRAESVSKVREPHDNTQKTESPRPMKPVLYKALPIAILSAIVFGVLLFRNDMDFSSLASSRAERSESGNEVNQTVLRKRELFLSLADSLEVVAQEYLELGDTTNGIRVLKQAQIAYDGAIRNEPADSGLINNAARMASFMEEIIAQRNREDIPTNEDTDTLFEVVQFHLNRGDSLFVLGEYEAARIEFEQVMENDQENAIARNFLEEIETIIAENAEAERFVLLLRQGDALFAEERLDDARSVYQQAQAINDDQNVASRLRRVEEAIREAARVEAKFQALMEAADTRIAALNYSGALVSYRAALELRPNDEYLRSQMAKVQDSIVAIAARETMAIELYQDHRRQGDSLLGEGLLKASIAQYERALEASPGDVYATDQIKRTNEALAVEISNRTDLEGVFVNPTTLPVLLEEAELLGQIRYPRIAREKGVQGRVVLAMVVAETGRATQFRVIRGIGHGCDAEAIRVFENAVFEPATFQQEPVKAWFNFAVQFSLSN